MKRAELKELGLEKDAIDKIMAIHGTDIETLKSTNTTLETEKATLTTKITGLETTVGERDTQLETLKTSSGDNEGLKAQISELQTTNAAALLEAKTASEKQIAELKLDNAINMKLSETKVKNIKAVKALMNLEEVKFVGDALAGVDDQLTALKESDSYLFGEAGDTGGGTNPPGAKTPEGDLSDDAMSALWGGMTPPK